MYFFLTDDVSTAIICAGASMQLLGWPITLRRLGLWQLWCWLTLHEQEKGQKAEPPHLTKLQTLQVYLLILPACLSVPTWNCCKQHCKQVKGCLQLISDKSKHHTTPAESNLDFTFGHLFNQPAGSVLWWVINAFEKTDLLSIATISEQWLFKISPLCKLTCRGFV